MSDPIPVEALPDAWAGSAGWLFAPVAAEVPDAWADDPAARRRSWRSAGRGCCGCSSRAGRSRGSSRSRRRSSSVPISSGSARTTSRVARRSSASPRSSARATRCSSPTASGAARRSRRRTTASSRARSRWTAIPTPRLVDPTGAGDTFLAAVLAARLAPSILGDRVGDGLDLRFGAAAASLVCERPGLLGVPSLDGGARAPGRGRRDRRLGRDPSLRAARAPPQARREAPAATIEVRLEPRMRAAGHPGPLEQPPRRPGRGEGALGIAEAVLAQLRDLDPGDRAERATGRGRGLPRLRRLRPATEPAQHAGPLGGNPLVRPARSRVPRRRARAPARARRRGRSPARPASRRAAPVRRSAAGSPAPATTRPRRPARGAAAGAAASGRTGRAPAPGRPSRRPGTRAPRRGAARGCRPATARRGRRVAPRGARPARAYRRSTCASSRPERPHVLLVVDHDARERVDRPAAQHVEVDRGDLPALDVADPADAQQLALDGAQPRVLHPVLEHAPDERQQVEVPGVRRARLAPPAGTGPRSAASRSRARCTTRATCRASPSGRSRRAARARRRDRGGAAGSGGSSSRPSARGRRGTRASRPRSRARSSPCRGTRAARRAAGGRAAATSRSRSTGMSSAGTTRRTSQPSGVSATSAPSAAASRRRELRAPAARERRPGGDRVRARRRRRPRGRASPAGSRAGARG